jgi:serine/threonine protein kinase
LGISKRIEDVLGISKPLLKGTPGYIAPELYGFTERGSRYAVDIWAVGEITFQILTKQQTFKDPELLSGYVNKPETFPSNQLLCHVSRPGVEFVLSAMHPIPAGRITAEKALRLPLPLVALPSRFSYTSQPGITLHPRLIQ